MMTFSEIVQRSENIRDVDELQTVLEQLTAKGLIRACGTEFIRGGAVDGTPIYELTDSGRAAARRAL